MKTMEKNSPEYIAKMQQLEQTIREKFSHAEEYAKSMKLVPEMADRRSLAMIFDENSKLAKLLNDKRLAKKYLDESLNHRMNVFGMNVQLQRNPTQCRFNKF